MLNELETVLGEYADSVSEQVDNTHAFIVDTGEKGNNQIIYDDQNNPNHMVWVPQFLCEDINARILAVRGVDMQLGTGVHPAFIKADGSYRSGFWCCKYLMSEGESGGTASVPMAVARENTNFTRSKEESESKGAGWHLMSIHEDAAVSLLHLASGADSVGNFNYGRDGYQISTGTRSDGSIVSDTAVLSGTLTGSGGSAWNHNGKFDGIADFLGNLQEYRDLVQLVDGQVVCAAVNDSAAELVGRGMYFDYLAGTITITNQSVLNGTDDVRNTERVSAVPKYDFNNEHSQLLKQLTIDPVASLAGGATIRNIGIRSIARGGGRYFSQQMCGVYFLSAVTTLTSGGFALGFRACYFED